MLPNPHRLPSTICGGRRATAAGPLQPQHIPAAHALPNSQGRRFAPLTENLTNEISILTASSPCQLNMSGLAMISKVAAAIIRALIVELSYIFRESHGQTSFNLYAPAEFSIR